MGRPGRPKKYVKEEKFDFYTGDTGELFKKRVREWFDNDEEKFKENNPRIKEERENLISWMIHRNSKFEDMIENMHKKGIERIENLIKLIANYSSFLILKEPDGGGWVARKDIVREAVPRIYPNQTSIERHLKRLENVGLLEKKEDIIDTKRSKPDKKKPNVFYRLNLSGKSKEEIELERMKKTHQIAMRYAQLSICKEIAMELAEKLGIDVKWVEEEIKRREEDRYGVKVEPDTQPSD